MANICQLKGVYDGSYTSFDAVVAISDFEEYFNVMDGENAGRSATNGRMIRDVIGAAIGHKVTFFRGKSREEFDRLWTWLKEHSVDDSIMIRAADNQTMIEYEAYYTSGSRRLRSAANGNEWESISVNFIPMEPQIKP